MKEQGVTDIILEQVLLVPRKGLVIGDISQKVSHLPEEIGSSLIEIFSYNSRWIRFANPFDPLETVSIESKAI